MPIPCPCYEIVADVRSTGPVKYSFGYPEDVSSSSPDVEEPFFSGSCGKRLESFGANPFPVFVEDALVRVIGFRADIVVLTATYPFSL